MNNKVILMILDGWGLAQNAAVSAIDKANTPFIDSLYTKYPHSKLEASGLAVGLPEGQMGNSEVGHMNLGAGRVVYQDLAKVTKALQDGELKHNSVLQGAFVNAKQTGKKLHFIGLVSDGGVHSHIEHLKGLLSLAQEANVPQVYVHAFTDGRDTDPKSGAGFLQDLQQHAQTTGAKIATVIGRYYAMDRDRRWERVKIAYDAMVHGEGKPSRNILESLQQSYAEGVTDEFIMPVIHTDEQGQPLAKIENGDVVICFNFRTDRGRQITQALTQEDFPEQNMYKLALHYVTLTNYDETFRNVGVVFEKDKLQNTLGEVLSRNGKTQIRIAETEKYPHVTFFFSGGREVQFEGESRLLCPSPKVATYDLKPEMSAYEIRDSIIPELQKGAPDFVCLNFANPDMVGHTGVFEAAVKACEVVDECARAVAETALANGYTILMLADHGNADFMINEDGSPNTAHTTNLVPFIMLGGPQGARLKNGKLGDVAPTILQLMQVPQPADMTGNVLIEA
ncbi:2,3-bisphosphoglycerate-independent phosphoglycerate mutase [Cesiribacter sp. SM1]|uniref:2,3-bisphosphoglycerate-independent phosphoglycerate mutase n=1 Tax=Cesiribacter sp. SM1 TaxID=2861196 RepID=UPI001CD5C67F|nr:2,3-bisphosphoglycerate-independent phosphoglycerate mutase [Cesiribacter sp. SM1]